MAQGKGTLTVIVNGTPFEVKANPNSPLHTIIPKALEESKNVGQPPDRWELRDVSGNLLPLDRKIADFHFGPDTVLSLSLKAGVGGD